MAEEKRVRVVFEAVGGSQAAADAARFKTELGGIADAEDKASDGSEALRAELARLSGQVSALQQAQQRGAQTQQAATQAQIAASARAIDLTSKLAGAAGAVQGLTSALGVQGGTAGLIAATAGAAAAGAQMGAAFGPQGALVGALAGLAASTIPAIIAQFDDLAEATRQAAADAETLEGIRSRLNAEHQARVRTEVESLNIQTLSEGEIADQRLLAEERLREAMERRDTAEQSRWRTAGRAQTIEDESAAIRRQIEIIGALGEASARMEVESRTPRAPASTPTSPAATPRRSGGGAPDNWLASWTAQLEEGERAAIETSERMLEALMQADPANPLANLIADLTTVNELTREQHEQKLKDVALAEAANDGLALQKSKESERLERESEAREDTLTREIEKREQDLAVFGELAGGVSRSLVTAVSAITSGAQTAEEAFKGMLASFLTSIAEQALISAMKEYAEAIGAFARYDFGGGAGHVAAGLAFTGVAIATGAAAGAVSAPPSQQAAASPDRAGSSSGDSGGRTVFVNNWNAPQVVAGTEADVGRTLGRLGRRSVQRFGRLAA